MQPTWQKLRENPELLEKYLYREKVIDGLREFFKSRDFHEVETPLLVKSPGTEPYLEVFETQIKFAEGDAERAFLLTSPEYAMKKLLVAGMKNIFQICKSFRNGEGRSSKHNHEFTILEYYRAGVDYTKLMTDLEEMIIFLNSKIRNKVQGSRFRVQDNSELRTQNSEIGDQKLQLQYQGKTIDLTQPWPRMSVAEAFQKWVGISADQLLNRDELVKTAREKGYQVDDSTTWEQAYNQLFLNEIEPNFPVDRPIFIYEYPISQAALSRPKKDDPRFAERFELYIAGIEIGNAFSELTDAVEQERRFRLELEERKQLNKTPFDLDEDFINALKTGMPESAGIAIGVDRLIMLFADVESIQETMWFPISELFN